MLLREAQLTLQAWALCRAPKLVQTTWNYNFSFQLCSWEACDVLQLLKSRRNVARFSIMHVHISSCTSEACIRCPSCEFHSFNVAYKTRAKSIKRLLEGPIGTDTIYFVFVLTFSAFWTSTIWMPFREARLRLRA